MPDRDRRPGVPEPAPLIRRFYTDVLVQQEKHGFAVLLDSRPVRTPGKSALQLPTDALARAIAAEWEAQGETIDPSTMPRTKIANTAIDRVPAARQEVIDDVCAFAASDLLFYRTEAPEELVQRQAAIWDPVIAWCETKLGRGRFLLAGGVVHVDQPPELIDGVKALVAANDPFRLSGLHVISTLTGSAILALAVADKALEPDTAWTAAHVDEDWQIEHWGEDTEATKRRVGRRNEFDAAYDMLDLA